MDHTTRNLLEVAELILHRCKNDGQPTPTWAFEQGSEAHEVLTEAVTDTRIALGIDRPQMPTICRKEVAV